MRELTPFELDALTEIINVGVGRSASSLSDIICDRIVLKVPNISLVPIKELHNILPDEQSDTLAAVSQGFTGEIRGSASLIFPPEEASCLVSALIGEDADPCGLDELRTGTLMEIGNIIINGLIGTLCNMLNTNLDFSLPEYCDLHSIADLYLPDGQEDGTGYVMLAEANLNLDNLKICGFLFIIFKIEEMEIIINKIDALLK